MIFRTLALLFVFATLVCLAAYIWTQQKKYLRYALKLLKIMVVCGLIFFGGLILERIL